MKKLLRPMAAVLGSVMLLSAAPVNAAYESKEEIAVSLRALSAEAGVSIPEDNPNLVYVSPEAAATGTTLHFGIYFETEKADLINLAMRLEPDTDAISFVSDTFVNPKSYVSDDPLTYTLPDGTSYSSRMAPYCLGSVNDLGVYSAEAFQLECNFKSEENALIITWMHGIGNISSFLGGKSDAYSFIEFDVALSPDIQPGSHSISFIADETVSVVSQSPTYVSSDISNGGTSKYSDIIPTLKNVEIIVESAQTEETRTAFRFAEDTNPFSLADFGGLTFFQADGSEAPADKLTLSDDRSPADLSITEPQKIQIPVLCDGIQALTASGEPAILEYWIGKRGDADQNGEVDSGDAAKILIYAAESGAGYARMTDGSDEEEAFALFLSNVTGGDPAEDVPDSSDAACILQYAAIVGAGELPDWNAILTDN